MEAVIEQEKKDYYLALRQTQTAHLILDLVKERGRVTMGELEILTNMSRHNLRRQLEKLVQTKLIAQNGVGKGAWYTGVV